MCSAWKKVPREEFGKMRTSDGVVQRSVEDIVLALFSRLMLLVIALLLLADMASVSYGRRIPDLNAMALGGGSPPAKCYFSKHASSSTSRQHLGDGHGHMHGVSKRLVPQGPNPLHN